MVTTGNMMIKKPHLLSAGLIASLTVSCALLIAEAKANTSSQQIAQAESVEPADACVAFQEVSTGETEIRKRIENRVIAKGNWNTDFLVPSGQEFSYFAAVLTPEHSAPYHFTANLKQSNGAIETPFSIRADLTRGETYSIPFESPTGRQPALINARIGGVNGNFYTVSIVGCK